MRVEALGALAHAALPPLRWQPTLARTGLPAWLARALAPGGADDDIALEAVICAGALCQPGTVVLLAEAGLVRQRIKCQLGCITSLSPALLLYFSA